MARNFIYFCSAFFLFLLACTRNGNISEHKGDVHLKKDSSIKYARHFAIAYGEGVTAVYLFGNKHNSDTTASYFICADSATAKKYSKKNASIIMGSCKKIAALSSIYATMFCELGAADRIAAIDNIDYVCNPLVLEKYREGKLKELQKNPQIDLEKTSALKPDIIFTFGMGDWQKDRDLKLEQLQVPIAISVDHLEESPMARAEWIKFFAAFVGKREAADSIFRSVEKNYAELKTISEKVVSKPSVFNEIKYSDAWYMPGGKSYVAQLLDDAGCNYLWKDDSLAGSLPLSFEQVYARAKDADFWINLSTLKTKRELLAHESRYSEFKAFKTGNLYNNTRVTNSKGYSSYWETGMIYPNRILSDLVQIFHPELRTQVNRSFFYYEQLK
jgi:iron complex transport system substrate-binding protein